MDGKSFLGGVDDAFYAELRRIAGRLIRGERQVTLSTTALVNEALAECAAEPNVPDDQKGQRAYCATLMYRRLIDAARRHRRSDVSLGDSDRPARENCKAILELDDLVASIDRADSAAAGIVRMRLMQYTPAEIAEGLGCSVKTVRRGLKRAGAFFRLRGIELPGDEAEASQ